MTVRIIRPEEVVRLRTDGKSPRIVDVRTPAEYAAVHADGAESMPLDALEPAAIARSHNGSGPLYLICQSGGRSAKACEKFIAAGIGDVFSIEGGTAAWERAGLPVVRAAAGSCRATISLERQVRIAAGTLVLLGIVLGWFVHVAFYGLSAFVGTGLIFAGITDWCGMGMLLARMPWNR